MHYKATTGSFHSMSIFRAKIVVGPKGKRRYAQGLGFTLGRLSEGSDCYGGIYFGLNKAKLVQKRLNKVIKEMERLSDKNR